MKTVALICAAGSQDVYHRPAYVTLPGDTASEEGIFL